MTMDLAESLKHSPSSKLSVDAVSFVPGSSPNQPIPPCAVLTRRPGPHVMGTSPPVRNQQTSPLPSYMMSCYPFVDGETASAASRYNNGDSSTTTRHHHQQQQHHQPNLSSTAHHHHHHHYQPHVTTTLHHQQQQPDLCNAFAYDPAPTVNQGPQPPQTDFLYPPPPPPQPVHSNMMPEILPTTFIDPLTLFAPCHIQAGSTLTYQVSVGPLSSVGPLAPVGPIAPVAHLAPVGPPPPRSAAVLPPGYQGFSSVYGYDQTFQYVQNSQASGYAFPSQHPGSSSHNVFDFNSSQFGSSKTNARMGNDGQNYNGKKKYQPRTRVTVYKDNSVQTDFNDKVASLTLAECPNTLYIKDQSSGDVDSDSGYSSPLHRKIQTTPNNNNKTAPDHYANKLWPRFLPGSGLAIVPPPPANQNFHASYMQTATHGNLAVDVPHYAACQQCPFPPNNAYSQPACRCHQNNAYSQTMCPCSQNAYSQPLGPCLPNAYSQPGPMCASAPPPNVFAPPPSVLVYNPPNRPLTNADGTGVDMCVVRPTTNNVATNHVRKQRRQQQQNYRTTTFEKERAEKKSAVSGGRTGLGIVPNSCAPSKASPPKDRDEMLAFADDDDEFPNLLSAAGSLVAQGQCFGSNSSKPLSYSDILKGLQTQPTSRSRRSSASSSDKRRNVVSAQPNATGTTSANVTNSSQTANKDSKVARKKQKRLMLAHQAAEEELAEICLEQQMLKELSTKQQKKQPSPVATTTTTGNLLPQKTPLVAPVPDLMAAKQSVPFDNISEVIEQLEKEKAKPPREDELDEEIEETNGTSDLAKIDRTSETTTTTVAARKGKEREMQNKKKPSSLKRVILKEREAKKCHKILDDCSILADGTGVLDNSDISLAEGVAALIDSLIAPHHPTSAEMSPVSQMSPINMTPLSGSPAGSGGVSPVAGEGSFASGQLSVLSKIHSRRFREYCNQVLDKEIDDCCTELLQEFVRYHDNVYHNDPNKTKSSTRRFVLGLREVMKHLKLGKLKCVIISPNLERIQSKGGLDDALNAIIETSQKLDVPFVFALGRRALGRACAKLVPVSVVGIFSYEGCEETFFRLLGLTQKAREAYLEMVSGLEREMALAEPPATSIIPTVAGNFEKLFPHLGHSRTPSACSAISFVSSILSEPISENYPQSEPETDSRGYEVSRDGSRKQPDLDTVGEGREEAEAAEEKSAAAARVDDDFDDGHEADTEEENQSSRRKTTIAGAESAVARESKERSKSGCGVIGGGNDSERRPSSEFASKLESTKGEVPPPSQVAATEPVGADTKPAGVVVEVAATTLVDGGDRGLDRTTLAVAKTINNERIESWVAESQRVTKQLRGLSAAAAENDETDVKTDASAAAGGDDASDGDDDDAEEDVEERCSLRTVGDDSTYDDNDEYGDTAEQIP